MGLVGRNFPVTSVLGVGNARRWIREAFMSVVLINSFEVPAGREDEFFTAWRRVADHLASAPGYQWTRLHHNVGPPARFTFVNVAGWESPEAFRAALSSDSTAPLLAGLSDFAAHPALYEVAYEHHA